MYVLQSEYRKNFTLSNFGQNFNAKLARKFKMCRINTRIGNNMCETSGIYHAQDLKQYKADLQASHDEPWKRRYL